MGVKPKVLQSSSWGTKRFEWGRGRECGRRKSKTLGGIRCMKGKSLSP